MTWAFLKKKLFGEYIEIVIYCEDKKKARKILKFTYKEAVRLEKIFNFYDNFSELNNVNKKRELAISDELYVVIKEALKLCKKTKGLYNISQGRNFLRRKKGERVLRNLCSYKDIVLKKNYVILMNQEALLDLGSIAKGYIADKVGDFLEKNAIKDYVINARGDLLIKGFATPIIRVQHPRGQEDTMSLRPKNAGIATSGDYAQYIGSYDKSHIVGKNSLASVTVIAPSLMKADLYATVFLLISKKEMKEILEKNKDLAVMTIDKNLKKEYYNRFKELAEYGGNQ